MKRLIGIALMGASLLNAESHWKDEVHVKAIDGVRDDIFTVRSDDGVADLMVAFENGKMHPVGISKVRGIFDVHANDDYVTVRYKIDDGQIVKSNSWLVTHSYVSIFPFQNERDFFRQLLHHNKLILECESYELTFDISGLADELKALNISEQQASSEWK